MLNRVLLLSITKYFDTFQISMMLSVIAVMCCIYFKVFKSCWPVAGGMRIVYLSMTSPDTELDLTSFPSLLWTSTRSTLGEAGGR